MNKKTILPKQQSLPHRQKIVVFTGAGISKESGMETPDFVIASPKNPHQIV